MVTVAIAGTGNIAYQTTKALHAHNPSNHTLILLSSSPNKDLTKFSSLGATIRTVDYASPDSLKKALEGVHTVISTIGPANPMDATEIFRTPQLQLLEAAKAVGSVKRFAPSEFATSEIANSVSSFYKSKEVVWEAVKASGLEYTAFRPGIFMNMLLHGSKHPNIAECYDGLADYPFNIIDLATRSAKIPGDGSNLIAFTTIQDIGKFLVRALDLPKWSEVTGIVGWVGTFNEAVKIVEGVLGQELNKSYVAAEEIEGMLQTEKDWMVRLVAEVMLLIAKGGGAPEDMEFSEKVKGEVGAVGLKEFVQKWWV